MEAIIKQLKNITTPTDQNPKPPLIDYSEILQKLSEDNLASTIFQNDPRVPPLLTEILKNTDLSTLHQKSKGQCFLSFLIDLFSTSKQGLLSFIPKSLFLRTLFKKMNGSLQSLESETGVSDEARLGLLTSLESGYQVLFELIKEFDNLEYLVRREEILLGVFELQTTFLYSRLQHFQSVRRSTLKETDPMGFHLARVKEASTLMLGAEFFRFLGNFVHDPQGLLHQKFVGTLVRNFRQLWLACLDLGLARSSCPLSRSLVQKLLLLFANLMKLKDNRGTIRAMFLEDNKHFSWVLSKAISKSTSASFPKELMQRVKSGKLDRPRSNMGDLVCVLLLRSWESPGGSLLENLVNFLINLFYDIRPEESALLTQVASPDPLIVLLLSSFFLRHMQLEESERSDLFGTRLITVMFKFKILSRAEGAKTTKIIEFVTKNFELNISKFAEGRFSILL